MVALFHKCILQACSQLKLRVIGQELLPQRQTVICILYDEMVNDE